ncbi:DUF2171 domain-containing protein [Allosphingosinicella flava]|uniref:DUF2171 domain-containing protein n=1 Tax=Allosphingosinicella flava TaxID=2771430 RepID=A0A7T2GJX8_9SPHN|nr:DUF2171 domain-containing protein [Sphingosinicella flava]QPQ55246.1 DUF2171 domain-containing protein [Sphingosinicella flava]
MVGMHGVRDGLQVLGSDGGMIGRVDSIEENRLRLHSTAAPAGHYYIPAQWIERVDEHVHLNVTAATARERWEAAGDGPVSPGRNAGGTTGDRAGGHRNTFAWIVGAIFILVILVMTVRSCGYAVDESTNTERPLPSADSDATGTGATNGQ